MHHCYSYICRSTGIWDDLLFLLNEELTRIQLLYILTCTIQSSCLHPWSDSHKIGSLPEANQALKCFGPESFHGDRISVKKKSGQESAISKQNIHVSSMLGAPVVELLALCVF